jgi:transketolase
MTGDLKNFAKNVRINILKMINKANSGHPGGALSCADILTVLYNEILNISNLWDKDPNFSLRDRFILSKGHASAALYSVLAQKGFFDESLLSTFRSLGSKLQGHPCLCTNLPGIEASTGSLGQGLSMGVGMALGLRLDKNPAKVFVLLGDGEMQEGSVWEALMNGAHQKLDNIVVIVDKNNLQIDGCTKDVKNIDPLDKKLEAFNWKVKTVNGHSLLELKEALLEAKNSNVPYAIIANTCKGRGVSFMENNAAWHGKSPSCDECACAIGEIENA